MRNSPRSIQEARDRQGRLTRTLRLPTRYEMSGEDIGSTRELIWLYGTPLTICVLAQVVFWILIH